METKFLKNTPISFLGTYPPRACGIGTFTHDLASAMADLYGEDLSGSEKIQIAALNDKPEGYAYGPEVAFEIRAQNQLDYRKAAKFLNLSQTRAVSIQHEYGIYGGEDGNYLIPFLHRIRKPVVTTLHTVVKEPTKGQLKVLQEVCQHSTRVAVLANKAISLLNEIYGVQKDKIEVIHHGTPDVPFLDTSYYKEDFQIEGRPVILTFGLLGPNKGLEIAIEAMEQVAEEFPEALYIILGATHPQLKQEQGERYRLSLENMVAEKGLEYNVAFHDRFVPLEELIKYMVSADIYLTPYLSREQISSGTLAYAIATGKAIVSTPYWYAEEMLADGRGELVPFEDPRATAETICELLRDEPKRQRMRKNAYKFGREMVWREVASSYAKTFEEVNQQAEERPSFPVNLERKTETKIPDLPEVNLQHLHTLTDDTGLFQHSTFTVPNRYHGYTTDDNARAAIAALQNWEVFKNKSILPLLKTYLSFLGYAFDRRKTCVRNFLNYDRTWQQEKPPEDSHGRFLWATGRTVSAGVDDGLSDYATRLFHQSFEVSTSFSSPRAWAFAILGGASYLEKFDGDRNVRLNCKTLGDKLLNLFKQNAGENWPWGEDVVSYENARLPQALLVLGRLLDWEEASEWGQRALDWLLEIQTEESEGHLTLIGSEGWLTRDGKRAKFDQQPVEAAALVDACYEAYKLTDQDRYLQNVDRGFNWFLGQNDLGVPLYNFSTGGCKDGLHSSRLNQNEGGESLVSWLNSLHKMYKIVGELEREED